MLLPEVGQSRKDKVYMAVDAMGITDALHGHYRAATTRAQKQSWVQTVIEDAGFQAAIPLLDTPVIGYEENRSGMYAIGTDRTGEPVLWLGPRPMTDAQLGIAVAHICRKAGIPASVAPAKGPVYDRHALMLVVLAMMVHDKERGRQMLTLFKQMKLTIENPVGGWSAWK